MSRRRRRKASARPSLASLPTAAIEAPAPDVRPPQPPRLTIREPASEADLMALHHLLLLQGMEMATGAVNPEKVWRKLVDACQDPDRHHLLMAVRDGRLVGHLCLFESGYWYSDETFLTDFGFYVLPLFRNDDVGPALLQEAKGIASSRSLPLFIHINNLKRRRGGQTGIERAASLIGYVPSGAMLAYGREPAANVLRQ